MQRADHPWIRSPYLTAGVALAGVGALAVTPGMPPLPHLPVLHSPAVQLTAGEDGLLSAWVDQFNLANENASTLVNNFGLAPGVGLQQIIVNQVGYLDTLINNPSQFPGVFADIGNNVQTVLSSLFLVGASTDTVTAVQDHTLNTLHSLIASLLPSELPDAAKPAAEVIVQLLSSPASATLIGALGPVISPEVSLINSVEAIMAAVQGGDTSAAVQALLATPADFVGSVFNGATLNLDALIPLLDQAHILPSGLEIDGLSYAFGGLLSPGSVQAGPYEFFNGDGTEIGPKVDAAGGSMLNSLGLDIDFDGAKINIPGEPIGPIASLEGFSQAVAQLLGATGWGPKSSPAVPPIPPLSTLTFPTISTDDGSAAAVSTDLLNALNVDDLGTAESLTALLNGGMGDLAMLPDQILNGLLGLF